MNEYKKMYHSRGEQLLNYIYMAGEVPSDLYIDMDIGYDGYRQVLSRLMKKGLIASIKQNGIHGYILTLKGKKLPADPMYHEAGSPIRQLNYSVPSRLRRQKFARLYAAFDKVGVDYGGVFVHLMHPWASFVPAWRFKTRYADSAKSLMHSALMGVLIRDNTAYAVYWAEHDTPNFYRVENTMAYAIARASGQDSVSAIMICHNKDTVLRIVNDEINFYNKKTFGILKGSRYEKFFLIAADNHFGDRLKAVTDDKDIVWNGILRKNAGAIIERSDYRHDYYGGFLDGKPIDFLNTLNLQRIRTYLITERVDYRYRAEKLMICYRHDEDVLRTITNGINNLKIYTISRDIAFQLYEDEESNLS